MVRSFVKMPALVAKIAGRRPPLSAEHLEATMSCAHHLLCFAALTMLLNLSHGWTPAKPRELPIPAFPGAEGYGMFTTGGRGGGIYEVTSLEDSGPGTLREAVSQGKRTVVFRISGTIELLSTLMLNEPNLTIAGQTAPGEGICLKNYALRVNTKNVIIRYLRVRPGDQGDDPQVDGISMGPRGGSDLIFDHCSVTWAIDENFSVYGLPNTTVQWCIIGESLTGSKHPKGIHGMGGILNGYDMSLHHNLFISNNDRNPKFEVGDWWPGKNTDFRNNVVYNWGERATWGGNGGHTLINVVRNYYKAGPSSRFPRVFLVLAGGNPGEWYVNGNVVEGADDISRDNWLGVTNTGQVAAPNAIRLAMPISTAPVTSEPAAESFELVLNRAGATLPVRDSVDQRLIANVRQGTGRLIDSPADVGGWPELRSANAPADKDHDGMPDGWEIACDLDPRNPEDRNGIGRDGYTNLEVYLNSLVSDETATEPHLMPSEAFWPHPVNGAEQEDNAPTLRWKAGFYARSERIYFGTTAQLSTGDFKAEKPCLWRVVNKQEVTSSTFETGVLQQGRTYYWRVDSVNEFGVTAGPTWHFTPGPPVTGLLANSVRVEAESMTLSGAFIEASPIASGGKVTSVSSGTGTMRFRFSGLPGKYNLTLCFVDESDGEGQLNIQLNGRELKAWTVNTDHDQFTTRTVEDVLLTPGDVLKITASRHRDELGRVDYLDILPVNP